MAALIYLDTHVVAFLYQGKTEAIPPFSRDLMNQRDLLISPMVLVELQYLFEIKRTTVGGEAVVAALRERIGLKVCDLPFMDVATQALAQDWTRDPFDRFIVSQAILRGSLLVTKDQEIGEHYPQAIWDAAD